MDQATIAAYDCDAQSIAQLHSKLVPSRIYALIRQYFTLNRPTLDIGCGIGRDTHWLNQHGYPTLGVDASTEMLKHALQLYSKDTFIYSVLPALETLANVTYQNILCSAVLMHLEERYLKLACERLLQLLNNNGNLIISYRTTSEQGQREHNKLYKNIDTLELLQWFKDHSCLVCLAEDDVEAGRGLVWHNLVLKKIGGS